MWVSHETRVARGAHKQTGGAAPKPHPNTGVALGQPSSFAKKLIPSAGLGYALGMKDWVFDGVLTENGWMSPGVVSVDEHGRIAGV